MIDLDSTPKFVSKVYETMARNLQVVRKRLGRPLTLADKILLSHLDNPEEQEMIPGKSYLQVRPDRVVLQDVLGQSAMLQFMQTGRDKVAIPTTIHCDHLIEARVAGDLDLKASVSENNEVYDFLKSAAAKYGAGFWAPGAGIIHQVNIEQYGFPGAVILGTDSHTPNSGGIGACAVGVGGADAIDAMAGLTWEVLYPNHIGVVLTGELSGWTAPKDIVLYLAGELTVSGGTNSIIEYFGPGAKTISCTAKATITNMGAELGATTSMFAYDENIARYLKATGRSELAELAEQYTDLLSLDKDVMEHLEKYFDRIIEIDLSTLEPHVVGPHSPDRARPISKLAGEVVESNGEFIDAISTCLIGSCTNSSYEDMSRAADLAEQAKSHGIKSSVPLMVTPGSEQIRATIERDGQMASLKDIGGTVLANACGPCIGQWRRESGILGIPNTIVTSYNRNFPRRNDGQATTMNFIAGPEITVALALAGRLSFNPLTDSLKDADGKPFTLNPPRKAPDVPEKGFEEGRSDFYFAPPDDGSGIELAIDPNSQRLQRLEPWPAWDGHDFIDTLILLKAKGKTTTDAISPAGPWLRLRGHLDKFSDNMFMGAINAYNDDTGKGLNVLTGERDRAFSDIARDYKARQVKWVVIGDWNYGEGSSREHAALSPRLLGAAAVIVRSFARIHESNLKKQGLLALTFNDPDEYDLIRQDDKIDLVNLAELTYSQPVTCIVKHADGTKNTLLLNHTYNAAQVEWFKAGSALNLM
jgi:aconitate hydratase